MTKHLLLLALFIFTSLLASEAEKRAISITVADTINPGSADYIISAINEAEQSGASYVLIQLDTPGGLLNSTRLIVQKMLNASIPVVVFVGPKGAQAGSAGAIISLAADVAAMAPGTNIGAAHPVTAGAEKMDKTMSEKVTNDTAAFAESLAKTKGRNTEWARKAVTQSASIIAEEALRLGVIDLMAADTQELASKLIRYKLKTPKGSVTTLPQEKVELQSRPPGIKHKVVSFFADPNLAYLIMSLGALCIYVELTHPGLIFPGVLGAFCILISLVSFQLLPISYGALALILVGMGLLIAELFVTSFGALGIGGILCFVIGSLYLMDTDVPEFQISPFLILPTAGVLALALALLGYILVRTRNFSVRTGLNDLVGEIARVEEEVTRTGGKVFLHGELWNAVTQNSERISKNAQAKILAVQDMKLIVTSV